MFKREVDRWVLWVTENLPTVAMLGETEVRRIVKRAINDLRGTRFVINFFGAFAGVFIGYFFVSKALEPPYPEWHHLLVLVGCGTVFTFATGKFADSLLIRKIEYFASGT